MTAIIYALYMPECSSCGCFLGHCYDDHVELTKRLETDGYQSGQRYIGTNSGIDISPFLQTYYTWQAKQPAGGPVFTPLNLVARALIAVKPLEPEDLPFGTRREADGQRTVFEHQMCCLRMFQGNPYLRL